jgi:hypothetical protein
VRRHPSAFEKAEATEQLEWHADLRPGDDAREFEDRERTTGTHVSADELVAQFLRDATQQVVLPVARRRRCEDDL